jgi:enamine deaminase RidA (YjgF/YER057c/UK114 family)
MIRRIPGSVPSRSRAVVHNGVIHAVATASRKVQSVYEQTKQCLASIDETLALAGSHKTKIISVMVYLTVMEEKAAMNCAWEDWVDPAHAPLWACIGARLQDDDLVELVVLAAE